MSVIILTRDEFEESYGEVVPDWFWEILRRNYLELMERKDETPPK